MNTETKRCPYCGKEIMYSAKKCRYCGKWLEELNLLGNNDAQMGNEIYNHNNHPKRNKNTTYYIIGIILFFLVCVIYGACLSSDEDSAVYKPDVEDTDSVDNSDSGSGDKDDVACTDPEDISDIIIHFDRDSVLIPHAQFDPEEDYSEIALWYVSATEAANDYILSKVDSLPLPSQIWNKYKERYKAIMLGMRFSPPNTEGMNDEIKDIMMTAYYKYKDAKYEDVEQQYKHHEYKIIFKNSKGQYYSDNDFSMNHIDVVISEHNDMIKIHCWYL